MNFDKANDVTSVCSKQYTGHPKKVVVLTEIILEIGPEAQFRCFWKAEMYTYVATGCPKKTQHV